MTIEARTKIKIDRINICYININDNTGMITVEASFLIPFLLFGILAILYIGLYYIDCSKVYCACDEVLYYAAESIGTGSDLGNAKMDIQMLNQKPVYAFKDSFEETENNIRTRIEQQLKGQLLLLELNCIEIQVTAKQVSADITGTAGSKVWNTFDYRGFSFSFQKKVQCANYSDFIRKSEVFSKKPKQESKATESRGYNGKRIKSDI